MAKTWPSGASAASDIDFRADIVKATLIPNTKWMFDAQSGPSRTMWGLAMAKTWPSGGPPASDIDFRTNILKQHYFPIKKLML